MESLKSAQSPIFIIGSYRSGTSVLTWCLGQHPNVLLVPETYWIYHLSAFMPQLFQVGSHLGEDSHWGMLGWNEREVSHAIGNAIDQMIIDTKVPLFRARYAPGLKPASMSTDDFMQTVIDDELDHEFDRNYELFRSTTDPKRRWVDGTPENTGYVFGLMQMFPNAKFVHILRNPHEIARSLMHFSRVNGQSNFKEKEAYASWSRLASAAYTAEQAYGKDRVFRIHYEELVENPENVLRNCCEFLGEEFATECLLPLRERINSSKVEEVALNTNSPAGRQAEELYRKIRHDLPSEPDAKALERLKADHLKTVRGFWARMALQSAQPTIANSRAATGLKKLARRIFS